MKGGVRLVKWIVILAFVAVLGVVGYFAWINIAYVDTTHARIEGPIMHVRSPGGGRVVEMPVAIGDFVARDEELGIIELALPSSGQAPPRVLVPLRAPIAGRIAHKTSGTGDVVSAGANLITLVDPGKLWVSANIHESRVPQVRVGQPARIRLRTRTLDRTFWGHVEQIGGATLPAMGGDPAAASVPTLAEVPVTISIDPGEYDLFPGTTAEVRIKLSPRLW